MKEHVEPAAAAGMEDTALAELMTMAVGPALRCTLSKCTGGGYVVGIDGKVSAARSTLSEAIAEIRKHAERVFEGGETVGPDAADEPIAPGLPDTLRARGGPVQPPTLRTRPVLVQPAAKMAHTMTVVLALLAVVGHSVWGV
jgi:hypothetical protein